MKYTKLLAPGRIGTLEVKNRTIMAPMSAALANSDGTISDKLIAYLKARADGGIGLIITEYAFVNEEGRSSDHQISVANDDMIPGLKKLTDAIHAAGAKICLQLQHGGRRSIVRVMAPSAIPKQDSKVTPDAMTTAEVYSLIDDFIAAAVRAKKAGFDMVEDIMDRQWTPRQEAVKQHFIDARGAWKWSPMWDTILELDAEIVDAYADYSSVAEKRQALDVKMRKLICVAIDSVTGCLNANGLKNHMKHSLQLGISVREILETLEITSMVGTCSYGLAMPLLYEACAARGEDLTALPLDERQQALKKAYMDAHGGYWSEEKENILRLDPEYFETFSRFENVPWETGTLSRKEKELLYIAVHAAPVTLHRDELKNHIERALDEGATWREIVEVIQIVSTLGIHAITMGVPILKEAIQEVAAAQDK